MREDMLEETLNKMRQAIGSGQFFQAEEMGKSIEAQFPKSLPLIKGLAISLGLQKKNEDALAYFKKAHALDPDDADVMYNIATLTLQLGRFENARLMFEELYSKQIKSGGIYLNYINTLIALHDTKRAAELCREALDFYPANEALLTTALSVYEQNNDLADAELLLKTAVDTDLVLVMKARIKRRLQRYDEALGAINTCDPDKLDETSKNEFFWEKGMVLEKHRRFDEAWAAFTKANHGFARAENSQRVDREIFWQELEWLHEVATQGLPTFPLTDQGRKPPVFFVGFPRSGTTLMEQILKAHSQIVTTEEDSPVEKLLAEIRNEATIDEVLQNIDGDTLNRLRVRFWEISEAIVGNIGEKVLLDKLPLNILWVPVIRQLFPNSKIVVAYRDPRDVCISAFIQKFTPNAAMVNFFDWQQTAKTYDAVMDVWLKTKDNLKEPVFEYHYEDLTDDYLKIVRSLLEYIGLEFEDDIQDYRMQAQNRVIKTPSYREVVNPINKNAVQRWKNYLVQIDEVMPVLKRWVERLS
jgi:tetratricopeptide (TPR) repeat protein